MAVGNSEPLISAIVPVYNATSSLHRSLRSVLTQTLSDFELIVIDDCSTDGSADILRGYEALDDRVKVLSTEKHSGPGIARNVGLRNAKGRYIVFLDSDDLWMKHKLEKQVLSFNNQDAILSCTSTVLLNPRGDILGIISGRPKVYLKDMNLANRITMSSAMIRKDLIDAEIMPRIRNRQDYVYWISLLQNNRGHIAGVQEPLVGCVKMPGSVSSNAWKNVIDTFRMYVSEVRLNPL